ncbi:MAG TPA: glutamate racemase [Longimicrobium sp.]|nr:glutamate racemase [Longimicrobium sp.]
MTAPVGVFDSGVGGLSVAREIRRALPAEHLLYVSDNAYLPYGDRTEEEVRARTVAIGEWIQAQGAKVLVVACNTASGAALEALRERLAIPVIGLEPALKPAVRETRNGRVGVMATRGTLRSARFQRLVDAYADGVQVVRDPCPGLADLVEDGLLAGPALAERMERYVAPLREAGVDTVVLGCTHYVFVRDAVQAALGPEVRLLDSGAAIARRTRQILQEANALQESGTGSMRVLTTGDPVEVAAIAQRLWGEAVQVEALEI